MSGIPHIGHLYVNYDTFVKTRRRFAETEPHLDPHRPGGVSPAQGQANRIVRVQHTGCRRGLPFLDSFPEGLRPRSAPSNFLVPNPLIFRGHNQPELG